MLITWTKDLNGLELRPTWTVETIKVHTVHNYKMPDGSRKDQIVLAVIMTKEQCEKIARDYGVSFGLFPAYIVPLTTGGILWTWKSPTPGVKDGVYTAFEVSP